MRLEILGRGHRRPVRTFFAVVRRTSGVEMADIAKVLLYRPELFGRPMLDLTAEVMRGDGVWPIGERERMAFHLAQLHGSPFCTDSHAAMTRIASGGELDPFAAPRPELAAALAVLTTTVLPTEGGSVSAVAAARAAGVGADALEEALEIAVVWNVVNRLANAFDFVLRDGQLEAGTKALHRMGYRFPAVLTRGKGRSEPRTSDREVLLERLRAAVFGPAGTTPVSLRRAAADGVAPRPWSDYVTRVAGASRDIDDQQAGELRAAGCTEDEIFEVTVAAAVGAALAGLQAGRTGLEDQRR